MNRLYLILLTFFTYSCTVISLDELEWGFDYLKKQDEQEVVPQFEDFGILPPDTEKEILKDTLPYNRKPKDSL